MFENPRRSRQARNFATNVPKILDLKSSSEQTFFRKLSLGAPDVRANFGRISPQHFEENSLVCTLVVLHSIRAACLLDECCQKALKVFALE